MRPCCLMPQTKSTKIGHRKNKTMPKLPKYTLDFNEKSRGWDLTNDKTNRKIRSYDSKETATAGGVLEKAVGKDGGSVKIQKMNGRFQEERTYPGSRDPKSSKG
ncbi:MAG: hypothetical protein UV00_C0012G0013 [candidate division WWE3 bacterium GW2011_GWF1_42_14]|uniref:DUF2188 domain-containing protein n=1 Tax=candidate division WWE3 bacterium GW2011_GWF1_42_14 TaxID=1619138 RepID=A0A0G0YM80_UNCKA|nr:MAG: hypothetical protein UU92_C0010G0013 [candidate division WWE3 bacterium GW2011_GWA1_42_12]KKS34533.1 MAG: hypothetical protein UU97_C0009G0013 [candidate division WWE3 bacterium GW2011_GWD1_42_14]KKS37714.1 MAG: hypothetical protein UV00_C0012G0013 [candidate division WWE3 bacterium GW2011_GWF1_42_14]KKS40157.1 MAG: hypothetical protein UV03_C0011G0013 [candidate division WWE3 bacterium GW2011_GWE1_42_16]